MYSIKGRKSRNVSIIYAFEPQLKNLDKKQSIKRIKIY